MKTATLTSGNHFFVTLEGAAYATGAAGSANMAAGTADRLNKPAAADPAWQYGGIVSALSIEPKREAREVYAPSPGILRLWDIIEQKRELDFTFTCDQMTRLSVILLFGADPNLMADAQLQYNPLEGKTIRAWLKVQQYDQLDAVWNIVDVWTYLSINSAVAMSDEIVKPEIAARTLQSALNTATVAGQLA
jgi:hypothetical protein